MGHLSIITRFTVAHSKLESNIVSIPLNHRESTLYALPIIKAVLSAFSMLLGLHGNDADQCFFLLNDKLSLRLLGCIGYLDPVSLRQPTIYQAERGDHGPCTTEPG